MKIRTRLSIVFSLITCSVFIVFGFTVYLFSANHRSDDFQDHLKKRVIVTEKIFLEKESFSAKELAKITDQFLHTLPQETDEVVDVNLAKKIAFKHYYPDNFITNYKDNNAFEYEDSKREGRCRVFNVKGKKYLIIVTAIDLVGHQNLSFLRQVILLLVLIAIPFIFLVSFIFTKRELLPLTKKIESANDIEALNFSARLSVYNPNDEIGQMAIAFNSLLDRLEAAFEAQKSFINNAAHEIKNPLTAIMGEAEIVLTKERDSEDYIKALRIVLSESERLDTTVNNLLQLSKVLTQSTEIRYEKINLNAFVFEVKNSFDFVNPNNQIIIEQNEQHIFINGNKNLLKTALINLFDNACKFSNNNIVEVHFFCENDVYILKVRDIGIGISKNDIGKITVPFYRGENAIKMNGSGIGLSLVSRIMNLHFGEIKINSEEGVSTEIELHFKKNND
jgi:signal transduction histidine kinase